MSGSRAIRGSQWIVCSNAHLAKMSDSGLLPWYAAARELVSWSPSDRTAHVGTAGSADAAIAQCTGWRSSLGSVLTVARVRLTLESVEQHIQPSRDGNVLRTSAGVVDVHDAERGLQGSVRDCGLEHLGRDVQYGGTGRLGSCTSSGGDCGQSGTCMRKAVTLRHAPTHWRSRGTASW